MRTQSYLHIRPFVVGDQSDLQPEPRAGRGHHIRESQRARPRAALPNAELVPAITSRIGLSSGARHACPRGRDSSRSPDVGPIEADVLGDVTRVREEVRRRSAATGVGASCEKCAPALQHGTFRSERSPGRSGTKWSVNAHLGASSFGGSRVVRAFVKVSVPLRRLRAKLGPFRSDAP